MRVITKLGLNVLIAFFDETEQEDWWTFENHATDFSFTAPAGRTFWISVTGAARDAGGRTRALTVRFY